MDGRKRGCWVISPFSRTVQDGKPAAQARLLQAPRRDTMTAQ
jgi:hypothetical protein